MRKQLKEKKRIKLRNKRLIKRYPWLKPYEVWSGKSLKHYDYSYTWLDDMERGWRIAFGDMLIRDIDAVLRKDHYERRFRIVQWKEKWGRNTIYDSGVPNSIYHELEEVLDKYAYISENVCVRCGTVDICMTNTGWILPICKSCYEKYINDTRPYEQVIDGANKMADSYIVLSSLHGKVTYDISATTNAVRMRYERRKARSNRRLQRLGSG